MTNAMIVLLESVKLMEEGIISGSGIKGITPDGKEIELPEAIHTYQSWKSLGYQVKKGEHAIAQFPVWKYITGKKNDKLEEVRADVDVDTNENKGYCRMKVASFFKKSQVEEIKK